MCRGEGGNLSCFTLAISSFPSKMASARQKTFRLRGVPLGRSKADTETLLKHAMKLDESTEITIRSLALDPQRRKE